MRGADWQGAREQHQAAREHGKALRQSRDRFERELAQILGPERAGQLGPQLRQYCRLYPSLRRRPGRVGRPRTTPRRALLAELAATLDDAGVRPTVARTGQLARTAHLMLQFVHEVVSDFFADLKYAVDEHRGGRSARWRVEPPRPARLGDKPSHSGTSKCQETR